ATGRPALIQGVMLDVTERKQAEEQLAFVAYHDGLTGLPNKAMFDELLELSMARAKRHDVGVGVLALDIDNFKLVNDSLGHEAGDLLRNADAAMFRAKGMGPGAAVVHKHDEADALTKLSLSTRLRKAVEQRVWALHYQPLIDLLDGSMIGVEALIRWPDPNGG